MLPELGRARRDALHEEFPTLADLAAADPDHYIDGDKTPFPGIGAKTLHKFQRRAALQLTPNAQPYLTRAVHWPQLRRWSCSSTSKPIPCATCATCMAS